MSDMALCGCSTCNCSWVALEMTYVGPPVGAGTWWLCPACTARLPVALDYIAESRGGGDPHAEYVERLESALMAGWFQLLMDRCGWHTGGWIGQEGFLPLMTPGQFVDAVDAFHRRVVPALARNHERIWRLK